MSESKFEQDKEIVTRWSTVVPAFFHDAIAYIFPPLAVYVAVVALSVWYPGGHFNPGAIFSQLEVLSEMEEESIFFAIAFLVVLSPLVLFPTLYVAGQLASQLTPIAIGINPLHHWLSKKKKFKGLRKFFVRLLIGREQMDVPSSAEQRDPIDQLDGISLSTVILDRFSAQTAQLFHKQLAYQEMAANIASLAFGVLIYGIFVQFNSPEPTDIEEDFVNLQWIELVWVGALYIVSWARYEALRILIRENLRGFTVGKGTGCQKSLTAVSESG